MTRENLKELIKKKKDTVGDGYLTDQGALFLVAVDLGVMIEYNQTNELNIAALSKDHKSVTLTCRVLSVGYPKTFTRKTDASRGLLMRLVIYDTTGSTTLNIWDRSVSAFLESEIGPGDVVKISNVYVRTAIDGTIALNTGENSLIERISESKDKQIRSLTERRLGLRRVPENEKYLILHGRVCGEVKKSVFSKSDGSSSGLTSFAISDGDDKNTEHRVVVWGNQNPAFEFLKDSDSITLLNVRTKISNFQNSVSVEIHGDETTCILERWGVTKSWMKELAKSYGAVVDPEYLSTAEIVKNAPIPFIGRVLSFRRVGSEEKSFLLVMDSQKRKISITAVGAALKSMESFDQDNIILCRPETSDKEGSKVSVTKEKNLTKLQSKRSDIPTSDSLKLCVEDVPQDGIISLEVMCLNDSIAREIQTKEGLVKRTELTVGDHTGEIRVYGWRSLSKVLDNYHAGDLILLGCVEVQTHEGKKFIQLKNYSTVRRLDS
ncbi:MAG: hypothetical protein JRN20_13110 [Nitrososphaerota archaeon]|nr:hypothetical protein [Nitrososphaerota archaeon]MDG6923308.1 hypothetical protein [Nitrososphaerota archaeon]